MVQILSGIQNTVAALEAERTRLDVVSENIANAYTTRCPDGKPYQRRVVVFESALQQALGSSGQAQTPTLQVSRIEKDPRPPILSSHARPSRRRCQRHGCDAQNRRARRNGGPDFGVPGF